MTWKIPFSASYSITLTIILTSRLLTPRTKGFRSKRRRFACIFRVLNPSQISIHIKFQAKLSQESRRSRILGPPAYRRLYISFAFVKWRSSRKILEKSWLCRLPLSSNREAYRNSDKAIRFSHAKLLSFKGLIKCIYVQWRQSPIAIQCFSRVNLNYRV